MDFNKETCTIMSWFKVFNKNNILPLYDSKTKTKDSVFIGRHAVIARCKMSLVYIICLWVSSKIVVLPFGQPMDWQRFNRQVSHSHSSPTNDHHSLSWYMALLGLLLRRDASLVILIAFTSCPSTAIGIGDVGANSIKSQTGAIHHTPMSSTRSTIGFRVRAPALVALSKVWSAAGRRFFCCISSTFCRCCAGDRGITWLIRWRSCRVKSRRRSGGRGTLK